MSEHTPCNYCTLSRIRRRAKNEGKIVTVIPDTSSQLGGINVYIHPIKIMIMELPEKKREKYSAVWFMSISDHCVC